MNIWCLLIALVLFGFAAFETLRIRSRRFTKGTRVRHVNGREGVVEKFDVEWYNEIPLPYYLVKVGDNVEQWIAEETNECI